jgi:hypothetical protein
MPFMGVRSHRFSGCQMGILDFRVTIEDLATEEAWGLTRVGVWVHKGDVTELAGGMMFGARVFGGGRGVCSRLHRSVAEIEL